MRWLTAEEEAALRSDSREDEKEILRSFGTYLAGIIVVMGWIAAPGSQPLLKIVSGNTGYNAFAFLGLALINVAFTSHLFYRSLAVHELRQLLTLLSPPDSVALNWGAWRQSNQSATKPVQLAYSMMLLIVPFTVSFAVLFGLSRILWVTDLLNARWTPLWAGWWVVLALHALPLWFGYHLLFPTLRREALIANVRGVDKARFNVPSLTEMAGWPVDTQALPDGTVLLFSLLPADLALLSRPELVSRYHHGRITVTRDTLRQIERLGARPPLLAALRAALGDAAQVELAFRHD